MAISERTRATNKIYYQTHRAQLNEAHRAWIAAARADPAYHAKSVQKRAAKRAAAKRAASGVAGCPLTLEPTPGGRRFTTPIWDDDAGYAFCDIVPESAPELYLTTIG